MLNVNWQNPYADRDGAWLKGALHIHTDSPQATSPCGKVPAGRYIEMYAEAGYDFISITDHGALTVPEDDRLILLPGMEWNSETGEHTGVYAPDPGIVADACTYRDQKELLARLRKQDCLAVLNHPNWHDIPHYRREELETREGYDGVEIYNSVLEYLDGDALATAKWDYLLTRGRRVIGVAGDDAHWESGVAQTWNAVRTADRSAAGVYRALQAGNFYASNGVVITDIRRDGDTFTIETENGEEIHALGDSSRRVGAAPGAEMTFRIGDIAPEKRDIITYVRFVVYGKGARMAWTQPFFIR